MTEETNLTPTSDERMMAALAHFLGMLGALIIWAIQKDKSRYVRFQAAQALAFYFVTVLLMGILFFCLSGGMFVGVFGTMLAALNSNSSPESFFPLMAFPVLFPSLTVACVMPFSLALLIARIWATISVLNGNDFRYPLLGDRVEKFLAD